MEGSREDGVMTDIKRDLTIEKEVWRLKMIG